MNVVAGRLSLIAQETAGNRSGQGTCGRRDAREAGSDCYLPAVTRASPDDPILTALRDRGSALRRIRYRENRSVLLSVGRDGKTLNCHACFRAAPAGIVEAIVTVVSSRRGSRGRRAALRTLREWEGTRRGLEAARRRKPKRGRRVNGADTGPLRALFRRFNVERFGGRLPAVPLRLSRRMTRSLGTIRYGETGDGDGAQGRSVVEIAISAELLSGPNRSLLEDTLLHEMAHAEAWLRHGHRGHGPVWRRVARRVGCRPRAVNDVRPVVGSRGRHRNPDG